MLRLYGFFSLATTFIAMSFAHLTPADWSQLEAYAADTLPAAARAAVEARLATDPTYRAALAQHHALVAGIRADGRAALRQRLSKVEAEITSTITATSTPNASAIPAMRVSWSSRWGRLAAAAIFLLAAGLGMWSLQTRTGAQAQADRYGVADPGLPVLMGATGPGRRPLVNQAMNAYKLGDIAGALAAWVALPAGAVGADTLLYYRGIFQLRLHQNAAAEAAMAHLQQLPATAFRARADYYFALALWAQNRPAEARAAFERLAATPNHPFRDDARLALHQLR